MELQRGRNSVYKMAYHLVWCVKYRKPVLVGPVAEELKDLLLQVAKDNGFTIEAAEIMPDHVHLFVQATPNHLVASMVKALKGVSARFLFKKFPELREQLWREHLWNPSYFVGTVGDISEETVKKYIEGQKKEV